MKSQVKQLTKVKGYGLIETPESHPLLLHFLTPLELAIYKNQFKKIIYTLGEADLVLEPFMCREVFSVSTEHADRLRRIIMPTRIRLLKKSDPEIRRFLLKPLHYHKLPPRIHKILAGNHCRKMEEVALKGERGLIRLPRMGRIGVKHIIKLFIENGCGSLFI